MHKPITINPTRITLSSSPRFAITHLALAISMVIGQAPIAFAQETQATDDVERIVVTGAGRKRTKLETSESVSTVTPDDIQALAPRSTAEIFINIPGIKAESTGGEGNANIAVRGLPVAAGGAKFLLLQEDGLPVMQFGDIAFGNSDIFLRADYSIDAIEAIRGGSASTFASNSPGGVINFISKTGEDQGGSLGTTLGLDYDSIRTDFEYGAPIANDWRFHIGGFFRQGDGPREAGYTANKGGQIKANLTKDFDNGYARIYFKHLNDKSIGYLPMPMYANGDAIPGFAPKSDTPHSAYALSNLSIDAQGNRRRSDVSDGMNPVVNAFGGEFEFELEEGWTLREKFRISDVSGGFNSPFPAEVANGSALASDIGGDNASLVYANGPQQGDAFSNNANGNGLAMRVHLFDVDIQDFGSMVNDIQLSKNLGDLDLTFGYYTASQEIKMSWLWNTYLMEVKGDNAALLDIIDSSGNSVTDNGLLAYGVPAWGNCCTRNYDAQYDISAPYLALSYEAGQWIFDASVRRDSGQARGHYAGAVQTELDVNNDGVISVPEQSVSVIDNANSSPINYDWSYNSYSAGVNYLFNSRASVYGRFSKGARANADRLLFGKLNADGSVSKADAIDEVKQVELGVKYRGEGYSLLATLFHAQTEEQNFEATSQRFFDRVYESQGIEIEASYYIGDFNLNASLTYTDAEISEDKLNPDVVGNTPRRQAKVIYTLTPSYRWDKWYLGAHISGSSSAYAQDTNELEFDAYTRVNGFVMYQLTSGLSVSLNANNLFNATGITEAEESVAPDNQIIRARALNGRTTSLTLKYEF